MPTPGRLECSVTSPPANVRAYIAIYNRHADYVYVTSAAVNDGDDVYQTYGVLEPGTYYIRLTDRDNDSSELPYTFEPDFTQVTDSREPNDDLGDASLISSASLTGIIFGRGEEDWFKIYADTDDTLNFTVDPPAEMRPYLTLYGPHTNYLYVSSQSVNPGDTVTLDYTATESGFYYLRLRDGQNLGHTETYTLSLSGGNPGFVPAISTSTVEQEDNDQLGRSSAVELDASVSGAIDVADDEDWYRMEVSAVGQLTVALTAVPGNLELRFRRFRSSTA